MTFYIPLRSNIYRVDMFQGKVEFSPVDIRVGPCKDHIGEAIRDTKNVNACNRMDRRDMELYY